VGSDLRISRKKLPGILVGFILLFTLALAATRVLGAPASLTETEYWTLVTQTRNELRGLKNLPADEIRPALDGLAAQWSEVNEVEMADGTREPVDSSFIVAALQNLSQDPTQTAGLLDTLLAAHETYPQNVFAPSDLDSLHAILSLAEFQWQPNPLAEWVQKLWNKFAAWLDKVLNFFHFNVPGGGQPITVVAVLILLGILAYVFRGLFSDLVKETDVQANADDDRHLTSETAFRKAQNLSGQGDYRTAVRYLYLSSLLMMEERGILRYDRSRTNREYLRSVSSHPNLAKPLKSVVEVFDRVWYGFERLDESTYKEYVNEVEELKEQKE